MLASESTAQVFGVFVAALVMGALYLVRRRYLGHNTPGEYLFDSERDVAIPPRCVACGSTHAPHVEAAKKVFIDVPAAAQVLDERYKRAYRFHFCLTCIRPIRRHRHVGRVMRYGGWGLVALATIAFAATLFVTPLNDWLRDLTARHVLPPFIQIDLFIWCLVIGVPVAVAATFVEQYSPPITVVDDGRADRILFRFRNRFMRDAFAKLNGAEEEAPTT